MLAIATACCCACTREPTPLSPYNAGINAGAVKSIERLGHDASLRLELAAQKHLSGPVVEEELAYLRQALAAVASIPRTSNSATREQFRVRNHWALRFGRGPDPATGDNWEEEAAEEHLATLRSQFPAVTFSSGGYPATPPLPQATNDEFVPVHVAPSRGALAPYRELLQLTDAALEQPPSSGFPYASGLYFNAARRLSGDPRELSVPAPARGRWSPRIDPLLSHFIHPLSTGKAVVQAKGLRSVETLLRADAKGAAFWARYDVLEPLEDLYLARYSAPGQSSVVDWFVPVADANGAARPWRPRVSPSLGSWFENPVEAGRLSEKLSFGRHSQLVLPRPRPHGAEEWYRSPSSAQGNPADAYQIAQERLAVPLSLLEAPPHALFVMKGPTWKPLQEDFVLHRDLKRFLQSDPSQQGGLLAVIISPLIQPKDLLRLLGSLSGRDDSSLLDGANRLSDLAAIHSRILDAQR